MNTKEQIKDQARQLFNQFGVASSTLRDVAKALGKSYGNITYHYPTKEDVLKELYEDYRMEIQRISGSFFTEKKLAEAILKAPAYTFELSMKYLFFFKDFVFLLRTYPILAIQINQDNEQRKEGLIGLFLQLKKEGFFREELSREDILYLMELSGAMRTFFFIQLRQEELENSNLKTAYIDYVNRLLIPYLSVEGRSLYDKAII